MSWEDILKKDIYSEVEYYKGLILEMNDSKYINLLEALKYIEDLILDEKDYKEASKEFASIKDRLKNLDEAHTSMKEVEYDI